MPESQSFPADLRPPEFQATKAAPFASDHLERRESVESLSLLIQNATGPLVLAVEGAYGTGKSAYLKMLAAHLESSGTQTVEFNAWQQGHTGRPLIDTVAALMADRGKDTWSKAKEGVKEALWRAASSLSKGIIAREGADPSSIFDDWFDIASGVSDFHEALHSQVEDCNGKLVILVDELDRCEPAYALDMLNKARHLFDVEGVVIVFGVNRVELGHAVRVLHGPCCDVDGYLRRFVDFSIQLRPPTTDQWSKYMVHVCNSIPGCFPLLHDANSIAHSLLMLVADNCGGRLRDVEQLIRHANLSLPSRDYKEAWPLFVICALVLRYIDREAYQRYLLGQDNAWEVMTILREHLPHDESTRRLALLDAAVLLLPSDERPPRDEDTFVEHYLAVRQDEDEDARNAYFWYDQLMSRSGGFGQRAIENLHKTIEHAAAGQL